jgi:hypothetical protein
MNTTLTIRAAHILTTPRVVVTAWEPGDGPTGTRHSTITCDDRRRWVGKLTSRRLPAEIAQLPVGLERSQALGAMRASLRRVALEACNGIIAQALEVFPYTVNAIRSDDAGETVVELESVEHAAELAKILDGHEVLAEVPAW